MTLEEKIAQLENQLDLADKDISKLVEENKKLRLESANNAHYVNEAKQKVVQLFSKELANYQSLKVLIEMLIDSRTHFVKIDMGLSALKIVDQKMGDLKQLTREFKDIGELGELSF